MTMKRKSDENDLTERGGAIILREMVFVTTLRGVYTRVYSTNGGAYKNGIEWVR